MRGSPRCPYCFADLEETPQVDRGDERVVRCRQCGTAHHQACFREHGGCTLLGCGGREVATGAAPAATPLASSLHPFLPLGEQHVQRRASFLSVAEEGRDRRKRPDLAPSLTLSAPAAVLTTQRLELALQAFTPTSVRGEGLRLAVRATLHQGAERISFLHQEAVVRGRPRRGWLERLKLWSRPRQTLLALPGLTTWRLACDAGSYLYRGPLPGTRRALGPVVRLSLRATAEGDPLPGARAVAYLVEGRPLPPALAEEEPPGPIVPAPDGPPLEGSPGGAWAACPVLAAETPPVACGWAARRSLQREAGSAASDALELQLAPLATTADVLEGQVGLALHRARLVGRLVLEVVAERRGPGDAAWRAFAVERAVLAEGSATDDDCAGLHRLAFQLPLPAAFREQGAARRRLRVRAALVGEGRPLRSDEHVLARASLKRRLRAPPPDR